MTRLIVGGNPFSGNSHWSAQKSQEMEDFFTTRTILDTLHRCEQLGINTMQMRGDKHIMRIVHEYRQEGGKMHWIAQTASEYLSFEGNLDKIMQYEPAAIYLHGTETDRLYKLGDYDTIVEKLAKIRETGVAVGLATHMPECLQTAVAQGWDVDFYMPCVYNLSRVERISSEITGKLNDEPFLEEDIPVMYRQIRSAPKPCLAFKILGAGRRCLSQQMVEAAFQEAFLNIKPTDAVIVGMFPKERDEVMIDTQIVRSILE